jgi:hypothetical protein
MDSNTAAVTAVGVAGSSVAVAGAVGVSTAGGAGRLGDEDDGGVVAVGVAAVIAATSTATNTATATAMPAAETVHRRKSSVRILVRRRGRGGARALRADRRARQQRGRYEVRRTCAARTVPIDVWGHSRSGFEHGHFEPNAGRHRAARARHQRNRSTLRTGSDVARSRHLSRACHPSATVAPSGLSARAWLCSHPSSRQTTGSVRNGCGRRRRPVGKPAK